MGNRVERVKTVISEAQMAQAVIEAWAELFGGQPSKTQVAILLAHSAHETGNWKFMYNYNVGNVTTDGKGKFDYQDELETDEQVSPGVWKKMRLKFISFPTLKDGVVDYMKRLSGGRYAVAWKNVLDPDPINFSKTLKKQKYYTANEAPYTKDLTQLYYQYNKSKGYDLAQSGQIIPPKPLAQIAPSNVTPLAKKSPTNVVNVLDRYMKMVAAPSIKKLYKTALPNYDILIEIKAADSSVAIEFARILCAALDEDLLSNSYPHSDGNLVEVECSIAGPAKECFEAVRQMSTAVAETFKDATIKIGGMTVETKCLMNKKSLYQPISHKIAETNYRKFLLKFI
jgi:hypothetical protein